MRLESLLTPNMRMLKDTYGFDTLAARQACVDQARLPSGSRVLDVGTSLGWMAIVLAVATHRVVAVDINDDALKQARLLATQIEADFSEKIEFLPADATTLPFKDDSFDGVFSFESLHHFSDCSRAVAEMYRVCRIGGTVVIADPNPDGLHAVRDTIHHLSGELHEENACRLVALEQLMRQHGQVEQQDIPFVSVFSIRKLQEPAV